MIANPNLPKVPAAAAPAAGEPPAPPIALVQSLQTPKKQHGESGDVTFGPISQQAAQTWMALLKRQSTDQFSAVGSPSPSPAATPAPKTIPVQPKAIPATTPNDAKANPTMQDDVLIRSQIVGRLMKMDDVSMETKMKSISADPAYQQFLAEVDQGPLNGSTLPTLVAFEFWSYEQTKTSQTVCNQPPPAVAVQQKPEETPAASSPAHVTPPTPASHMTTPAPTGSEPPTPASLEAAEVTDQEDLAAQNKEARACYMRYYRSVRSPKCPAPVAVKFREASADPTGQKLKVLFAEYLECGENWLASSLVLKETQSNSHTDGGRWGWLTRDDPLPRVMVWTKNQVELMTSIPWNYTYQPIRCGLSH